VSKNRVLRVKVLRMEASVKKLRLPKAEVLKWTRAIDLRWMHGTRYGTSGIE
jgi:hypothetical protein